MKRLLRNSLWLAGSSVLVLSIGGCVDQAAANPSANRPQTQDKQAQIIRGRQVVIEHDCGGCHGGGSDPSAKGWLAGSTGPQMDFKIGPCAFDPKAMPCFNTRPRNLTPDNTTGLGRFSERQIFNALRHGLRPGETPDVEITGDTPGKGNFPANPKYLAIPMPWPGWRHMPDADLWAIAAYLKNGVKPVTNKVADSEGPPDFWASEYTVDKIGPFPAKAFPTANEKSQ
jgi:mono/diheme cytochrome c family protein